MACWRSVLVDANVAYMPHLTWLDSNNYEFPDTELALEEPNGLLAAGGDLSPDRLIAAYKKGIFPWYEDPQPILWWTPNPRSVLFPNKLHISRSLKRTIARGSYHVTFDQAFFEVVKGCSLPRKDQHGTWITNDMHRAYTKLHSMGIAHSVEVWQNDVLAGGLYGLALGRVFFGESMFSLQPDASKVGFCCLVEQLSQWGFKLVDCQVETAHLNRFGAELIPRTQFNALLKQLINDQSIGSVWQRPDEKNGNDTVVGNEQSGNVQ